MVNSLIRFSSSFCFFTASISCYVSGVSAISYVYPAYVSGTFCLVFIIVVRSCVFLHMFCYCVF